MFFVNECHPRWHKSGIIGIIMIHSLWYIFFFYYVVKRRISFSCCSLNDEQDKSILLNEVFPINPIYETSYMSP